MLCVEGTCGRFTKGFCSSTTGWPVLLPPVCGAWIRPEVDEGVGFASSAEASGDTFAGLVGGRGSLLLALEVFEEECFL